MKHRLLFAAFMMVEAITSTAFAQTNYDFSAAATSGQTLYYKITNSSTHTVAIVGPNGDDLHPWDGYTKPSGALTIPTTVQYNSSTYTITSIANSAFRGCNGLTGSLTIPNTVTSIGDNAFAACNGLNGSLTISNSVTSIGTWAFTACWGFTGTLTLSNSLTVIGECAFYNCSGFTGQLTIPNSLIYIENCAFYNCSGFTGSLTIPNSVTYIGVSAFRGCSGFNGALTISNSATYIGGSAFWGCSGFSGSLNIPNSVTSIGNGAFAGCSGFTGTLTIPNTITSIGDSVFKSCSGFTGYLTIPNSVTSIGSEAFWGCSGFTGSLTIPNSVTSIGNGAFSGCSGLTGILTIPNAVTSIGNMAFLYCGGFTGTLIIPNSVLFIGERAFEGCAGFTGTLAVPNSVTTISNGAFWNCSGFTSVTIPNSVTSIVGAFGGCSGLISLTSLAVVPPAIVSNAFYDVPDTIPVYVPCGSQAAYSAASGWSNFSNIQCASGASIVCDTTVSRVCATGQTLNYYLNCDTTATLTGYTGTCTGPLTIPDTVMYNGMAYPVTVIGNSAFSGCSGLTGSLIIPNTITVIDTAAFDGCSGFDGTLTIPNSVTSIGYMAFERCTRFTGALPIPNSVTYIGKRAFFSCSSFNDTLTIPSSVSYIGDSAFAYCTRLRGPLVIPDAITSIGIRTFCGCRRLSGTLHIPNSVTYIGTEAFYYCRGFTSVISLATVPPTIGNIENYPIVEYGPFDGIRDTIPVYVPCGSQASYRASGWNYFSNIQGQNDSRSTETVTACDSYTWHGTTYTASTDSATYTTTNAAGCDSIVTLHLTIQQRLDSVMDTAVCDAFVWAVNTQFYSTTGIYRDSVYHGVCWDRYTVNLTLNYSIHSWYILSVCDSVRWHGDLYTTSARYLRYDTVASGCINSDTLYLTVKHSTTGSETATACNVYVWHNRALTASTDTATYRTTNAAGCDSTVTLNLTINQCSTTDITTCDTFTWNGTTYAESGTYIHGTDTLNLTVNYSTAYTVTDTACNSYTWHNTTYTTSTTTATYTTTNAAGCDSVVTLHLTVNHDSSTTVNASASSTYTWHNTVYTSSGTYTYNYTTVHGCNGEERLFLTILTPDTLPSNVPTSGLIAYYPFDNSPYDASGNGNHGLLLGNSSVPVAAVDRHGDSMGCYQFGGMSSPNWIKVNNSISLHLDTALSVSFWVSRCVNEGMNGYRQRVNCDYNQVIIAKDFDRQYLNVEVHSDCDYEGDFSVDINQNNRGSGHVRHPGYTPCDWVHFVLTMENSHVKTYIDGVLMHDTVVDMINNFSSANNADLFIGALRNGSWYPLNCKLDDIGLWNRALTPDEIQSLYGTQLPPPVVNFTVRAASANSTMGSATVVGNSTVQQGAQGTVQAIANSGYRFVRWSDGSTANPYTFTVTQDTLLTAYFEGNSYTVTVVNGNPGRGMVSGSGTATYGSRRNISAAPNYGYTFSNWSDGDSNSHRTITVTSDITLTAYFGVRQFHIGVAPANYAQGTVTGSGDYDYMSTVTIEATPANGYEFAQWSDGDTLNPRRITVMRDSAFTATFREVPVIPTYTVTATSANTAMGSVTGGGSYEEGTVATLTARANDGYEFVQWNDGVTANPRSVTVLSDTAFTATFREVYVQHSYTVSVLSNDGTLGRVSGGGIYSEGATVHIAAYPLSHCRFVRWSDGVTEQYRTFTAERDISLIAFFARDSVNITARANDDRMGRVTGGGSYAYGSSATLTATPLSGYRFVRWSTGERTSSITVTVRNATSYTAFFDRATQGVDEAEGAAVCVWSHGLTIHVAGLTGEPLKVYDVTGRLVAERTAAHGDMVIPVTHPGLYLVQTGTTTHKVLTR